MVNYIRIRRYKHHLPKKARNFVTSVQLNRDLIATPLKAGDTTFQIGSIMVLESPR